jgi:hypothetical protein
LWAVKGTPEQVRRHTVTLLLFWEVFGFRFSWGKGQLGSEVQWIGAHLRVVNAGPRGRGVEVELPEDKSVALLADTRQFLSKSVVGKKQLRRYAGQASFLAGLVPHLKPFLSGVWAALRSSTPWRERGTDNLVHTVQVSHSLKWLRAFLTGVAAAPLRRCCYLVDRKFRPRHTIAVDASPWGIGGWLMDGAKVICAFADAVQPDDIARFEIEVGRPEHQALLEALALLVAVRLFSRGSQLRPQGAWQPGGVALVRVKSDSKAAIGTALRMASPDRRMNAVGRELAFDQAVGDYHIDTFIHTPGVANVSPDYLSRLSAPDAEHRPEPPALRGVPRVRVPGRSAAWWRTWDAPEEEQPTPAEVASA